MDSELLKRFTDVFFVLLPDCVLTPEEMKARIAQHGIEGFLNDMDDRYAALIETAGLLSLPGKGGR